MIMIDFARGIPSWLPASKRKPYRIHFLRIMINTLQALFNEFNLWRHRQRKMVNLTSQVQLFEAYLNDLFGVTGIFMQSKETNYIGIGLDAEGEMHHLQIGLNESEPPLADIPLSSDNSINYDVDIVCYAPAGVDLERLKSAIERYKLATKTFKIIQL